MGCVRGWLPAPACAPRPTRAACGGAVRVPRGAHLGVLVQGGEGHAAEGGLMGRHAAGGHHGDALRAWNAGGGGVTPARAATRPHTCLAAVTVALMDGQAMGQVTACQPGSGPTCRAPLFSRRPSSSIAKLTMSPLPSPTTVLLRRNLSTASLAAALAWGTRAWRCRGSGLGVKGPPAPAAWSSITRGPGCPTACGRRRLLLRQHTVTVSVICSIDRLARAAWQEDSRRAALSALDRASRESCGVV